MARETLVAVLEDARALLARDGNDFSWSGWADRDQAIAELDLILDRLVAGLPIRPAAAVLLFLPTGPLQEVSISSGWGDAFIDLARRFDSAIADL